MTEALMLIDIQEDYFPGGKNPLKNTGKTLSNILLLEEYFHQTNKPVFYIQHLSNGSTPFFIPNTGGAQLSSKLSPKNSDEIIIKHEPNSFYHTDLMKKLVEHRVNELTICGWMTQMCLDTTVRQAYEYGYDITVISDGCTTKDLSLGKERISADVVNTVFLSALNSKFGRVKSAQTYLKEA